MSEARLAAQPSPLDLALGRGRDYFALLKPRVMTLVVFTALVGLLAAPPGLAPSTALLAILATAVGAGAAGCLNMWYDRDIDRLMARTRARPLPAGRVSAGEALALGLGLSSAAVLLMALGVNTLAASLLALTIAFYVLIYTVWLKRRTAQNIVIGGAAGALPPVIGWAAATGELGWPSLAMFAIVFLWTPPHFWALALVRAGDYERAGVPMLPVVSGQRATRRQIFLYTLLLIPTALLPWMMGAAGLGYAGAAALLSLLFARGAWILYRSGSSASEDRNAKRLFGFSILYLLLIFVALLVDSLAARALA